MLWHRTTKPTPVTPLNPLVCPLSHLQQTFATLQTSWGLGPNQVVVEIKNQSVACHVKEMINISSLGKFKIVWMKSLENKFSKIEKKFHTNASTLNPLIQLLLINSKFSRLTICKMLCGVMFYVFFSSPLPILKVIKRTMSLCSSLYKKSNGFFES